MPDNFKLSIIEPLIKKKESLRSWNGLEQLISRVSEANGHFRLKKNDKGVYEKTNIPVTVERRRLKALCEDGDYEVPLRISELIAINRILSPVDSLTEKPILVNMGANILHSYKNQATMCVMIGTRFDEHYKTDSISTWDFRAFKNISEAPDLSHLRINMLEIYNMGKDLGRIPDEGWQDRLDRDSSITAIASPYVCHATEYLLSRIFNIPNQQHGDHEAVPRLPCYLVWPKEKKEKQLINECLNLSLDEVKKMKIKNYNKIDDDKRAFLVGKKLYISQRIGENHGLIVAQRQPENGKIFLVLCGTYGPTTHAMGNFLAKGHLKTVLPRYDATLKKQPVLTAIVKVNVDYRHKDMKDDQRENRKWNESATIEDNVLLWTLEGDEWKSKPIRKKDKAIN